MKLPIDVLRLVCLELGKPPEAVDIRELDWKKAGQSFVTEVNGETLYLVKADLLWAFHKPMAIDMAEAFDPSKIDEYKRKSMEIQKKGRDIWAKRIELCKDCNDDCYKCQKIEWRL